MQLAINLEADEPFSLPLHYNHLIQGFIYEAIDPELSRFLHDYGYRVDKRPFRLFVFSRLLGEYQLNRSNQTIFFEPGVRLWIASPLEEFCHSMVRNIVRRGDLHLGKFLLKGVGYNSISTDISTQAVTVKTLSPVTVYSTLLRPDGRKYTAYFQPGDPDYNRLITDNLKRKYQAIFQELPPEENVSVRAVSRLKMNIIRYKGFIIKGYSGLLKISGPKTLLNIALNTGLGAKNSQGFGFIQIK